MEIIHEFLTVKEFAEKLQVHQNTIRLSIRSGRINAFKIGSGSRSEYRIPYSEIQRIAEFDLGNLINKMVEKQLKERERK